MEEQHVLQNKGVQTYASINLSTITQLVNFLFILTIRACMCSFEIALSLELAHR